MNRSLTLVDLFAGCGGLSLGLEYAGFKPVFVSELSADALQSYLLNRAQSHPQLQDDAFHCRDIKDLVQSESRLKKLAAALRETHRLDIEDGELDLLVGGPPCQGFSEIGRRRSYSVDRRQLPSNHLYQDMAYVIARMKPRIFLFENVRGLLHAKWAPRGKHGEVWEDVLGTFEQLTDYTVRWAVVRAADYGVPQNRPRVLMVGVRRDISKGLRGEGTVADGYLPTPSGRPPNPVDLLGDLIDEEYPQITSTGRYPDRWRNNTQRWFRTRPDGTVARKGDALFEHEYSNHSPPVHRKFRHMLRFGSIPPSLRTKKFAQRVIPQVWPDEGPLITATSLPDDYVHFAQPRILTVREWARLQGFPDHYMFAGPRTTGGLRRAGNPREGLFGRQLPRYTQIGNAVPVWLAKAVGEHFARILDQAARKPPANPG
jgi:DNA (cytosine-5)-methyltransferase 1